MLREVGLLIRQKEAVHLDIAGVLTGSGADARTKFVCPPLATRRHLSTAESENVVDKDPDDEFVQLEDLLRGDTNLLFVSNREGGKTSLANHIAVLTSEGLSDKDRIPFILSYKSLMKSDHAINEEFLTYYKAAPHKLNLKRFIAEQNLLFIVDDVALAEIKSERDLSEVISKYPGCRWILLGNTNSFIGDTSRQALSEIVKQIHIRPLPRRAIREMSKRWCQITGNNDLEANNFIVRHLRDNNLPRTGYIISLLMWAYQKEKKLERINEAYLLNAVIDSLLGKADFTKALRKEFDPILADLTLQHLAIHLRKIGSSASANDIIVFLVEFFRKKSLEFNAGEVLNKLVECGVLQQQRDEISFKYRCFQEFFVASHLIRNTKLIAPIVTGDILEYKRELYLLSGLRRQNEELIDDMIHRLQRVRPKKLLDIKPVDFALIADKRIYDEATKKKLTTIKTKKMTSDQVDDLLDAAEKEIEKEESEAPSAKKNLSSAQNRGYKGNGPGATDADEKGTISAYMNELGLLGSIIKNSEFDDGEVKERAIAFYLGESLTFTIFMVKMMTQIIDDWFADKKRSGMDGKTLTDQDKVALKSKIVFIMEKILVTIMTLKTSDELASEKMSLVFRKLFDSKNVSNHDKLLLGLIMYDLNQNNWLQSLENLVEENEKRPFMLDVITERLWHDLYTRYEPEERRAEISQVVDLIAAKLGAEGGRRRRSSRQAVDKAAFLTQTRDG